MPEIAFSQNADPYDRHEAPHLGDPHARRDTEDAQVECQADADRESHPDGVKGEDAGKGEQRRRADDPLTERSRLQPEQERIDIHVGRG